MTEHTVDLDKHRGMAAQKATEMRRLITEVAADMTQLRARQEEVEKFLFAAPAETWAEAVEKARYLLSLFSVTIEEQDSRRKLLVTGLLEDFDRLLVAGTTVAEQEAPPTEGT